MWYNIYQILNTSLIIIPGTLISMWVTMKRILKIKINLLKVTVIEDKKYAVKLISVENC